MAPKHLSGLGDYNIYYFGDFDQAGHDAMQSLCNKMHGFAKNVDPPVNVNFYHAAITEEQVHELSLSTRPHKRNRERDRQWPHDFACELDAMDPDTLRDHVRVNIEQHLPAEELARLKNIEAQERETFMEFVRNWREK